MKTLLALTSLCCLLLFNACSGLRSDGSTTPNPKPRTAPAFGTGVSYYRDGRSWYQLRVKLELPEKYYNHGSLERVTVNATGRLWQYNRKTKEYDIPLGGEGKARMGLRFTFDTIAGGGELRILPTNGTDASGQSGLKDKSIHVAIDFSKAPDPDSPGGYLLVASADARLLTNYLAERAQTEPFSTANVQRTWKVHIDTARRIALEELP